MLGPTVPDVWLSNLPKLPYTQYLTFVDLLFSLQIPVPSNRWLVLAGDREIMTLMVK